MPAFSVGYGLDALLKDLAPLLEGLDIEALNAFGALLVYEREF